MNLFLGFGADSKLNAPYYRRILEEAETQIHGAQALLVSDNHDNTRSIDRFGDGVHNVEIAKAIATVLSVSAKLATPGS
jgi:alpha-glucosidase